MLVNFAIFVVALLAFRFFLQEVVRFSRERAALNVTGPDSRVALPEWALLLLGYSIFLWASLELVSLYDVSPDQAVLACVCLAGRGCCCVCGGIPPCRPSPLWVCCLGSAIGPRPSCFRSAW